MGAITKPDRTSVTETRDRPRSPAAVLAVPDLTQSLVSQERDNREGLAILRWHRGKNPYFYRADGTVSDQPPTEAEVAAAEAGARLLLGAVEQALEPATPEFLASYLGVLAASFPPSRKSDKELEIETEVYLAMLAPYPADIHSAAGRHVLATLKFFPSVAELLDTANDLLDKRIMLRNRVAEALAVPVIPRARKTIGGGLPTDIAPGGFSHERPGFLKS